jgi:hypothetical protein
MSPAVTNGPVYLMFTGGARSRDRRLCELPVLWAEQRRVLGFDAENAGMVSLAGRNFPPGFRASDERGGFNRSSQNPRLYGPTGGRWRCEDPLARD